MSKWKQAEEGKPDLLVLFTSFWCSVRTLSFASGGMNTKSMDASSSKTSLRGGLGEPKSSFVWRETDEISFAIKGDNKGLLIITCLIDVVFLIWVSKQINMDKLAG